jgi:Uma2 family endonuclease
MYRVEENNNETFLVNEPTANYGYTYADYIKWNIEERIELFKGRILKLAAPNTHHQSISGNLFLQIANFLKKLPCKVFAAPFDVRLPKYAGANKDEEIVTVVQPDICVICNPNKLDTRGCCGAPDLVIEILSPGNSAKEVRLKYDIYQEAGVLEYWLINPVEQNLIVYSLDENTNEFYGGKMYTNGDLIISTSIKGMNILVDDIFEN